MYSWEKHIYILTVISSNKRPKREEKRIHTASGAEETNTYSLVGAPLIESVSAYCGRLSSNVAQLLYDNVYVYFFVLENAMHVHARTCPQRLDYHLSHLRQNLQLPRQPYYIVSVSTESLFSRLERKRYYARSLRVSFIDGGINWGSRSTIISAGNAKKDGNGENAWNKQVSDNRKTMKLGISIFHARMYFFPKDEIQNLPRLTHMKMRNFDCICPRGQN